VDEVQQPRRADQEELDVLEEGGLGALDLGKLRTRTDGGKSGSGKLREVEGS
jgi:hypothetical protein